MLLLALAAAQLSSAEPKQIWFSNYDTPVAELAGKRTLWVLLRLTIPPDGRVHRCEIEQSSGNPKLDQYTCDLTRRRAQFRAARSADGTETYGVYRVPIVWTLIRPKLPVFRDVTLVAKPRPRGVRLPAMVRLIFAVDSTGKISNCTDAPPRMGRDANEPRLSSTACDALLKGYVARPAIDDAGQPVPSIQNGSVLVTKA